MPHAVIAAVVLYLRSRQAGEILVRQQVELKRGAAVEFGRKMGLEKIVPLRGPFFTFR